MEKTFKNFLKVYLSLIDAPIRKLLEFVIDSEHFNPDTLMVRKKQASLETLAKAVVKQGLLDDVGRKPGATGRKAEQRITYHLSRVRWAFVFLNPDHKGHKKVLADMEDPKKNQQSKFGGIRALLTAGIATWEDLEQRAEKAEMKPAPPEEAETKELVVSIEKGEISLQPLIVLGEAFQAVHDLVTRLRQRLEEKDQVIATQQLEISRLQARVVSLEETKLLKEAQKKLEEQLAELRLNQLVGESAKRGLPLELPTIAAHFHNVSVFYLDPFLDEYSRRDQDEKAQVVKALKQLFHQGPQYSALETKSFLGQVRGGSIPKDCFASRASKVLRFIWKKADDRLVIFWLGWRRDMGYSEA